MSKLLKSTLRVNFYQLLANGLHLGHHYKQSNFLLDRFFLGRRFSVIILNLLATLLNLRCASFVLYGCIFSKGSILFVVPVWYNTNIFFYLRRKIFLIMESLWANFWISGFLTNHKRLMWAYTSFLRAEKLTRIQKKNLSILSLDVLLESLPGVVISLNRMLGNLAMIEASALRIPVIGLVDSNVSGGYSMYPILSNDDSYKVIYFFILFFSKIILVAKMSRHLKFGDFFKKIKQASNKNFLRVNKKMVLFSAMQQYRVII